jgi:hypothetical protein
VQIPSISTSQLFLDNPLFLQTVALLPVTQAASNVGTCSMHVLCARAVRLFRGPSDSLFISTVYLHWHLSSSLVFRLPRLACHVPPQMLDHHRAKFLLSFPTSRFTSHHSSTLRKPASINVTPNQPKSLLDEALSVQVPSEQ